MLLDLYFHHQAEVQARYNATTAPGFKPIVDADVRVFSFKLSSEILQPCSFASARAGALPGKAVCVAVTPRRSSANAFARVRGGNGIVVHVGSRASGCAYSPSYSVACRASHAGVLGAGGATAVSALAVASCSASEAVTGRGVKNPTDEEVLIMMRFLKRNRLTRSKNYDLIAK